MRFLRSRFYACLFCDIVLRGTYSRKFRPLSFLLLMACLLLREMGVFLQCLFCFCICICDRRIVLHFNEVCVWCVFWLSNFVVWSSLLLHNFSAGCMLKMHFCIFWGGKLCARGSYVFGRGILLPDLNLHFQVLVLALFVLCFGIALPHTWKHLLAHFFISL